ncbi:recombination mediator RecR [Candidatus Viadribacter manganicus]|uniref:Recombination protein RecR n=1 Tax=Candidatus Viadribacter manganicus TaxID=1759059 RepID=A0A1B1AF31_9PROT|nr:recombination mediator RecR [Candidatus Viadribacter manganicus]ANP45170.1 recombination protein RecR [Candidatus Viadribacter manganicus]
MRSKAITAAPEIEALISLLAKVPGLGPRSARRAALQLLKRKDQLMAPLAAALAVAAEKVRACSNCGALDTQDPCMLCAAIDRDDGLICVVAEVGDVWALERAGAFKGRYHVLGGTLSALDGVRPDDLRIAKLLERASGPDVREVILALSATVDGQTTAHYLAERLQPLSVTVSRLSHGVPVGGELDLLDDGTLFAALQSRRPS